MSTNNKKVTTRTRIRKRSVVFGNPSLGTYRGVVYTADDAQASTSSSSSSSSLIYKNTSRPLVEGAVTVDRVVAMVDVPPEQVPEGVLNVARSHRPWIDHVRIVIVDDDDDDDNNKDTTNSANDDDEDDKGDLQAGNQQHLSSSEKEEESKQEVTSSFSHCCSPTASAAETAASILAADEHQQTTTTTKSAVGTAISAAAENNNNKIEAAEKKKQQQELDGTPSRTYLVLFELSSEKAANQFVEDLNGQPYTCLDETQVCSVFHVVALVGEGGVSLMSPFFAPTTKSNAEGGLEILPSNSTDHPTTISSEDVVPRPPPSSQHEGGGGGSRTPAVTTEDYNCAVCLEHMHLDRPTSATSTANNNNGEQQQRTPILTTVCNHSFHMNCLLQWQDSPCPVCRYDHSGLNEALSQCHVCGKTENNFVCLICGVVSCGGVVARRPMLTAEAEATTTTATPSSNKNDNDTNLEEDQDDDEAVAHCRSEEMTTTMSSSFSHARQHYDDTLHAYALDTESQHVWDFAGQGYVHRLLQNKEDGKLVEVSDPNNTTSQERSLNPGLSEQQEDEVVHRKLEGFASQYYTLLKSQLEQQRIYYEGRLEEIRREYDHEHGKPRCRIKRTSDLIAALKQERHQLSQRLGSLQSRCNKVQEDVAFLKSMNESLEANKVALRQQVAQAQQERMETKMMFDDCLPPLQEKVTMLMLQLESEGQEEGEEEASKKPADRS